jgi:hypothetical protein
MINQVYYDTDSTDVEYLYKPTHQELNIRDDVNLSPDTFQREVVRECMLHFILADVDSNASQYAESVAREEVLKFQGIPASMLPIPLSPNIVPENSPLFHNPEPSIDVSPPTPHIVDNAALDQNPSPTTSEDSDSSSSAEALRLDIPSIAASAPDSGLTTPVGNEVPSQPEAVVLDTSAEDQEEIMVDAEQIWGVEVEKDDAEDGDNADQDEDREA